MTFDNPGNLTSITKMMDYADSVSNGWFYPLIPITLWLVTFMWLKGKGYYTSDSMMAASFGTFIICGFLWLSGGLTSTHMIYIILIMMMSTLAGYWQDQKV